MAGDEPRAGTNLDISRRVERLEDAVSSMALELGSVKTDIALIKQDQGHIRDLVTAGFSGMRMDVQTMGSRVETLTSAHQLAMAQQASRKETSLGMRAWIAITISGISGAVILGALVFNIVKFILTGL